MLWKNGNKHIEHPVWGLLDRLLLKPISFDWLAQFTYPGCCMTTKDFLAQMFSLVPISFSDQMFTVGYSAQSSQNSREETVWLTNATHW